VNFHDAAQLTVGGGVEVVVYGADGQSRAEGLVAGVGARAVGVASDADGLIPEALEERLSRFQAEGELPRVKAVYLVPYFDNPAGTTMPRQRRAAVVEIAKRWSQQNKIHVISDEAYRELRYEGEDLPSPRVWDEDADTVIVAGTFSKSFSPGIHIDRGGAACGDAAGPLAPTS
jgi:2-aminoadipate transaminase